MKAYVKIDPERQTGRVNPRIFGHLLARRPGVADRGLHYPEHPTADPYGIRQDVEPLIRAVKPTVFRWPGGCTGTSYHWMDGVGPVEARPNKIDLHFGWEANHRFGTNEFLAWCRRMGAEPLLNFAMGTGTFDEAFAWVEYCNGTGNTPNAKLRRQHGFEKPWDVQLWQLGNEMYGEWEIGQTTAASYGETAREWAKAIRRFDPRVQIVAVGGILRTNLDWARTVVPKVAPYVDLITFHAFWLPFGGGDPWYRLMASPNDVERMLEGIASEIRVARAYIPNCRDLRVAITEWNGMHVLHQHMKESDMEQFEPTYGLQDALANATFWNILKRRSQQVGLATTAQIVNVEGHIMVHERVVWREPIYWPLYMQVNYGGPMLLDTWVDVDAFSMPEMKLEGLPYLDVTTTLDPEQSRVFCSLVNRHPTEGMLVQFALTDCEPTGVVTAHLLYHDDPEAKNGPDQPDNVRPRDVVLGPMGKRFEWEMPPHSYAVVEIPLRGSVYSNKSINPL